MIILLLFSDYSVFFLISFIFLFHSFIHSFYLFIYLAPSYESLLQQRQEKLANISTEVQQFASYVLASIINKFIQVGISPNFLLDDGSDVLSLLNPKNIITKKILQPNSSEIGYLPKNNKIRIHNNNNSNSNSHNDSNSGQTSKISLKYVSLSTKSVISPSESLLKEDNSTVNQQLNFQEEIKTPHVGIEVLGDCIKKLYVIEDLLIQLHTLKQQQLQQLGQPIEFSLDKFSAENISPSDQFPTYRQFLSSIDPNKPQTHTKELYLQYLESILQTKIKSDSTDNPLLPESVTDKIQNITLLLLQNILGLYQESDMILVDRFQSKGSASYFETLLPLFKQIEKINQSETQIDDNSTNNPLSSSTSSSSTTTPTFSSLLSEWNDSTIPLDFKPVLNFKIGQIVQHKQFSYRGVCAGYNIRPNLDVSNWEGVKNLTLGQEQPFYKVSINFLIISYYYYYYHYHLINELMIFSEN